jgi:hypothetical protein
MLRFFVFFEAKGLGILVNVIPAAGTRFGIF